MRIRALPDPAGLKSEQARPARAGIFPVDEEDTEEVGPYDRVGRTRKARLPTPSDPHADIDADVAAEGIPDASDPLENFGEVPETDLLPE